MKEPREVQKHGKSRWLVDLREFGGGRHYRKTQAAARRFQAAMLQEQAAHGQLAFDLPHETRRRYLAAEVRLADLGATLEQVIDWFAKTHRPRIQKTVTEAVKECLAVKRAAGRRPRYLEQFAYTLESFAASVGHEIPCFNIELAHVEKWLSNPDWKSPRTKHGKLIDARTFFSFCLKRQWITADPSAGVEEFTLDDKPPGILTVPQCKRLLTACVAKRPRLLPWLTLALFCGIRPTEELRLLSWENVNLGTGYVEIPANIAKGRQRRLIKLQPNALAWLELGKALNGDLPPLNWRRRSATVRKAAKFAVADGAKGEPWPHDALRHSFCSYALPIFGAQKVSDWAGHSEAMLYQHYRELVTEEAAREFWALTPSAPV